MKKWLRRALIAVAVIGLMLAGLYEYATHVGRGWLQGEAFYQVRPTSYWRWAIEDWVDHFETPDDAASDLHMRSWTGMISSEAHIVHLRPSTFWDRTRGWAGLSADHEPPLILGSLHPPEEDSEPVLRELEQEPALQRWVEQARRQRRFNEDMHKSALIR
jgi:hypothetical protein